MAELLLELFSEEIPARLQARAADDLKRLAGDMLAKEGFEGFALRSFATPRRLVLVAEGLAEKQKDTREERRGPRLGSPEQAMAGFLKSVGLQNAEQCESRDGYYYATLHKKGRRTSEILATLVPALITALPWAKSMRWGTGALRWVRPLQSVLCLFGGRVVPFNVGELRSGDTTRGHRFLSPAPFAVRDFADYAKKLSRAQVMLDGEERRAFIQRGAQALAAKENLVPIPDEGLLAEVAGLVEWPVMLIGRIDPAFMDLPPELLRSVMRQHQKYFALRDEKGALAPRFVLAANTSAADKGAMIVHGNERVLRARFSDARFHWDQDRRGRLESHVSRLDSIVFHAKLGSMGQKAARLEALTRDIAAHLPIGDANAAARAGKLAKADLVTGMVFEFPELQGVMGRYYALHDGEDATVAQAIGEHYAPLGPSDAVPQLPLSMALSLADKIDTLSGFFAVDEKPTGSKDPFALRRAALGIIRIILENNVRLSLRPLFDRAGALYGARAGFKNATDDLMAFIADRLKVHLRESGVRHDQIAAVFALGEDDLVRVMARVKALAAFLASENGASLLTAYKRADNIVAIESKKDNRAYDGAPEAALLVLGEEKILSRSLDEIAALVRESVKAEKFAAAMQVLSSLRESVDAFFDRVTVNCEEAAQRENRLKLLSRIRATMNLMADFSQIEG